MQTPDNFTSLAALLLPPQPGDTATAPSNSDDEIQADASESICAFEDVRLFRARLLEALECSIESLCGDLAREVIARELLLAPADVRAISEALIQRYACELPVRIRVDPSQCDAFSGFDVSVVADEHLGQGDVMLDVANGTLDASLAVRLQNVLSRQHR